MLSGRYVHLVETHAEEILNRTLEVLRRDPALVHLRLLLDHEHKEWGKDLLRDLDQALASGLTESLAKRFESLGERRFEQEIPLDESVRALSLFREKIMDFVEEHIGSNSSIELYAEEEMARRLTRLFDVLLIHLVRGYQRGFRRAAAA